MNYQKLKDKDILERIQIARNYLLAGHMDEAKATLMLTLDLDPSNPEVLFLLGKIHLKQNQIGMAEVLYRKALEKAPHRAEIWGSIGRAIDSYLRPEEAFKYFKKALEMDPTNESSLVNYANALQLDGQYEESLKWAQKVVEVSPNSAAGHDNVGMAKLALGDFTGWDDVLWGLGVGYREEVTYGEEPRWDGSKDKTVIVYAEQGLGDEILYCSCIPDMVKECDVIVDCDPRLEGLFKRSFPDAHVYGTRWCEADWPNKHKWDARVSMGTLPMFYRRTRESFPGTPFLVADPLRRRQWRLALDELGPRPKIGVAWTGGGQLTARANRSIDLEQLRPLAELGDLINLEYEKRDTGDFPITTWNHATLTANYDDAAALIAELDMVISVCCSNIHTAGGLGVETHVLVPEKPSWRYNLPDMPWYDSVTLHKSDGDWDKLIQNLVDNLKEKKAA